VTFIPRWPRPAQDVVVRTLVLILAVLFAVAPGAAAEDTARAYRLGTGDRITIAVFGEPDLAVDARVADSGRIAYPFIGELRVAGRTPAEVEQALVEALRGDWLVDPKVSVSIVEYRPFFINGQVRSPGSYPYQPGMTVRKAVSTAGGFSERASERAITLIPEGERDRGKGRTVGLDDPIGPGDILTVGESFF
jgi:polysaccharide biosynthesis/export protein VpsN